MPLANYSSYFKWDIERKARNWEIGKQEMKDQAGIYTRVCWSELTNKGHLSIAGERQSRLESWDFYGSGSGIRAR